MTKDTHDDAIILDCTVRDGSYAVDFKFTESDTALLTAQLARLGFQWIEVGHGLGIGAVDAGKTPMPADDLTMIRAAKDQAGEALVGAFFIPWFGGVDLLDAARDAGLDFVRFGENAMDIENTFPYVERARKLGLIPCVNMMKTYGVSPEVFAEKTRLCAEAGSEVVYCVDSAGGMLPDVVGQYFEAARSVTDCELGFHGHNNLMLGVANCVAAYKAGARYLDTSLCGFGRSAGNVPTEILVAVLNRMDVDTGVDLFELMDLVDTTMWPLVRRRRTHDMMAVTAGYAQFHSSFLPKVSQAACDHDAELRRLVSRVGQHDPVSVDDAFLESSAHQLANTAGQRDSRALVAFDSPAVSPTRLASSRQAVRDLIDALVVSGAKRQEARTVLHLMPSDAGAKDLILADFVLEDSLMVLGRVTFGSFEILDEVLELARDHISLFLVSRHDDWSRSAVERVQAGVGRARALPVRDEELHRLFLAEALDQAAQRFGNSALLVYGSHPAITEALGMGTAFESVFRINGNNVEQPASDDVIPLGSWDDWRNLNLMFDAVICGDEPGVEDAQLLARALKPDGGYISIAPVPAQPVLESARNRLVHLQLNQAYAGIVDRALAIGSLWQ